MSKSMFEKNDFKGVTTLSLLSTIQTMNEENPTNTPNKVLIITSFGIIQAEEIVEPGEFEDETITDDNFGKFIMQTTLNSRNNLLKEYDNGALLDQQTSFILKDVTLRPFNSTNKTKLPIMLLFSEDIVGLTFGEMS